MANDVFHSTSLPKPPFLVMPDAGKLRIHYIDRDFMASYEIISLLILILNLRSVAHSTPHFPTAR